MQTFFALIYEKKDLLRQRLAEHIQMSITAIVLAALIGFFLGYLAAKNNKARPVIMGVVNFIYTIPSIAMFGFLLPIMGIGPQTAVAALIVYGILPMVKNSCTGVAEIDRSLIEAAGNAGCRPWQMLIHIELPLASPTIFTGLRTLVVMTIALAGIASFVGAGGLGSIIWRGITTYNLSLTFIGSLVVAVLAVIADQIMAFVEKKVSHKLFGENK